jgi:putative ABC transport system permease protein
MIAIMHAELRDALRRLRARSGQAVLAVGVLGAGLAGFLFTLLMLDGIVLARPPFANAERVVNVSYTRADDPRTRVWIGTEDVRMLMPRLDVFARVAAYTPTSVALRGDAAAPTRVQGMLAGASLFEVLGIAPALGRAFSATDDSVAAPLVAVLSDALWHTRFQADAGVLGRIVHVDGRAATVVGVLPPGVDFEGAQVYLPARLDDPALADETFMLSGLLAEGRNVADVGQVLSAWFADAREEGRAAALEGLAPVATPLLRWVINDNTRAMVWLMLASGLMVLLLAATNTAHLLLAQAAVRSSELATRAALGSSRRRLVAGMLLDALLVCAIAMLLGLVVAEAGGQALAAQLAASDDPLPPWMHLTPGPRLFAWAALTCGTVAAIAAAGAMWRTWRLPTKLILRGGGQVGIDAGRARLGAAMTVVQVALAGAMLLSALVCVRMLYALDDVEWGTRADPARVLSARIALPAGVDAARARQVAAALARRVGAEPGVTAAAVATTFAGDSTGNATVRTDGADTNAQRAVGLTKMDQNYLDLLGVPLRSGRAFSAADVEAARDVALVDAHFARALFGDADPVGRRVLLHADRPDARWLTVIGTLGALHLTNADDQAGPDLLVPFAATQSRYFVLTATTSGDPTALAQQLPALVAATAPDAVAWELRTQTRAREVGRYGIVVVTTIMAGLAGLGLLLAAAGLYAVLSLGVTQRTREIGLRRAIGARGVHVVARIGRRGMACVMAGLVLGLTLGAPLAVAMAGQVEGRQFLDPWLFCAVAVVVLGAAALALWVPLRRALRIDLLRALRAD